MGRTSRAGSVFEMRGVRLVIGTMPSIWAIGPCAPNVFRPVTALSSVYFAVHPLDIGTDVQIHAHYWAEESKRSNIRIFTQHFLSSSFIHHPIYPCYITHCINSLPPRYPAQLFPTDIGVLLPMVQRSCIPQSSRCVLTGLTFPPILDFISDSCTRIAAIC